MTAWLLALVAGLVLAALHYARQVAGDGPVPLGLALLRAAAMTVLVALLLDAPAGRETPPTPLVVLDASRSWTRGDTVGVRWAAALGRARAAGGDSVLLTGDSLRLAGESPLPADVASSIGSASELAATQGRPLVLVTDGEITGLDPAAAEAVPRGSRVDVLAGSPLVDAAVATIDALRSVAAGDTLRAAVTLRSGGRAVPAGTLTLRLDEAVLATVPVRALEPYATRRVGIEAPVAGREGARVLRAVVSVPGDAEARNDTMGVAVDVSAASGAVWISSAPDLDGRAALAVLRGSLAVPTRAFLQVAPGTWLREGSLAPVGGATVREAVREAPMLIIHGDTAVFGAPRSLAGDAPLALLPGPDANGGSAAEAAALDEWYPTAAPPSPAAAALQGIPWDSLPPVSLTRTGARSSVRPRDGWVAVEGRRARRGEAAPFIVGTESPRRVVVSRATGMWRWRARGGVGATAYEGLWGSVFDWMADSRRDRRAAVPERASVREGEAVRWRIAADQDGPVGVELTRQGDTAGARTLMLTAAPGAMLAESAPLPAGVYDARTEGGRSVLVVNAAEELLPRARTMAEGHFGRGAVAGIAPSLRNHGIAYASIVVLLCVEWALRRRRGLQ